MHLLKHLLLNSSWAFRVMALALFLFGCKEKIEQIYPSRSIELAAERAMELSQTIRGEVSVQVADGLELSLWASDTLISDPIAISIDEMGKVYYTSAKRQTHSEFDIRSHRNWMTASISFQSVEDRRAFLRKTFSETNEEGERWLKDLNEDGILDWRDLTVEKEQVWFVEDLNADGVADRAQLYLEDFHEEITDVANGIEVHQGEVFIAVGPDLWRTQDRDGDGIADKTTSLSHGYAVHIGFGAHGMSGAKIGPDGRIWWGIGDIGMNVVDQDGKNWKYPNQGVIVRSELDGSGFEVYAAGLRNTHEFVFDQYGNLISEDNDGDHEGERERLVYLLNGSDTGWRINWQFGKYTDPDNNGYKVWMDEKLHIPRWEGQAAYILPTIANYVNGPTGMVFNPGTALSERWYNHFFIAEFRGTPANSPVHAFTLKPKGASFELDRTQEVVRGVLPTGMDFGPDGALYFSDWIDGWDPKNAGRIWKLDVPGGAASAIRSETMVLLQTDFKSLYAEEVASHLAHKDMRIRQKAQFDLVGRGKKGYDLLLAAARESEHQLARIHGIWGIGQMARAGDMSYAQPLLLLLSDTDEEIITQAAKILGDIRMPDAGKDLIPLLSHNSLRVQLHAAEALGRLAHKNALQPLVDMLEKNNDQDAWLRHAGIIALGRLEEEAPLVALANHPSKALRTAAVVALRRMNSPKVAEFLRDTEEYVATEAARAINDDFSISKALPALAAALEGTSYTGEPFLRRAINANSRVGAPENIDILINYIARSDAPPAMRAEAIAVLGTWAKPSVFDRVDGRYRGEVQREDAQVKEKLGSMLNDLLASDDSPVQIAAALAASKLQVKGTETALMGMLHNHRLAAARSAALQSLSELKSTAMNQALRLAFNDKDPEVRSLALSLVNQSDIPQPEAVSLFKGILERGTVEEQQAALAALSTINHPDAVSTLSLYLDRLIAGRAPNPIQLDIIEAAQNHQDNGLKAKLETYEKSRDVNDPLSAYREALEGGNPRRGGELFYRHEAAQCVRCHAVFEMGGTAGPSLAGVASRLGSEALLRALVEPSAEFSEGYQVVTLNVDDGVAAGVVVAETADSLSIKTGGEGVKTFAKTQIKQMTTVPSSMPPMGHILTKREIRDMVAFLKTLHGEE